MRAPIVVQQIKKDDVVTFIADITTSAAPGKKLLTQLQEITIPLVVVYGPGVDEPLKTQAYTAASLVQMIKRARGQD